MSGEGDNTSVYTYNGVDGVPMDVTNVRVDPSVTIISEEAFEDCCQLEQVELPEGLIRIDDRAFHSCKSLKTINLPSTLEEIDKQAFVCCDILEHIILPMNLRSLGMNAFQWCTSLKSINIPPNITEIEKGTFLYCFKLTDISFSEGLQQIERDAFSRCKSLVSVNLPSSVKDIGMEAFEGCKRLNEVHLPDTIESIEEGAFYDCNFPNFRIPPKMTEVDINIVGSNSCFISLELPETVTKFYLDLGDIQGNRSEGRTNVRNISLPSNCEVDLDAIHNCTDLGLALLDDGDNNVDTIIDALQHRFDNLPIHKICYYQSYYDNETTMQSLKREINPWTSKPPGQLNVTGNEQDCLGMTPLHILACSTKPTIEMYRLLIDKYPETLIMKDKWGDIPLLYAFWCNASTEVIDLLVESHKTLHLNYEFNWKRMIKILVRHNVPLMRIQKLVNTQHNSFPKQEYDMQQLVTELASHDASQASFNKSFTSVDTIQYLLRVSIAKRLDTLGISRWRVDLENCIKSLPKEAQNRVSDTQAVYERLAAYEIAKEGTSVLELALWKSKTDMNRDKRAKVDSEISYREQCRINCGADIIIRNVLPYLLPKTKRTEGA